MIFSGIMPGAAKLLVSPRIHYVWSMPFLARISHSNQHDHCY
jgi:hypothetical protein